MTLLLLLLAPLCLLAQTVTYDLSMTLRVPAIVDNSQSLGKRVYKVQHLKGSLTVKTTEGEPEVSVTGLWNKSHRMSNGKYVTYSTVVEGVGWHVVGDNRKGVFKKPSVFLSMEATPSYALADGEDNTLIVTLAGGGSSDKVIHGYVSGQLGCGCYAYGHVSPTRIMWNPCAVVDTAAVWGTWKAKKRR